MTDETQARSLPDVPPRFQFGLFSMFLVTTAVAVACSLTFSMPTLAAIPLFVLFSVILSAMLITVIIYGRGYQRTFCIGAVVPFGVLLFTLAFVGVILFLDGPSPRTPDDLPARLVVVGFWASSILVGGVCVGVRVLIEKRNVLLSEQENFGLEARNALAAVKELLMHENEDVRNAVIAALEKIKKK